MLHSFLSGSAAQSAARPTEKPDIAISNPAWPSTFVEIEHGIVSMVILPLPLKSRRAFVSYWRKYAHKVLVNRLGKVWLG